MSNINHLALSLCPSLDWDRDKHNWVEGFKAGVGYWAAKVTKLENENKELLSDLKKIAEENGYCSMCCKNKKGERLNVCQLCYDSFDGDRRCFWEDEDY